MSTVILVEIAVTSPAGVASTLRFSDRAIRPFPPADADRANIGYDPRILEAPTLRRTLFDDLTTMQPGLAVGAMTLANTDYGLDAYDGYVWGQLTALLWTEGTAFSAATTLLKGLCAPPSYSKAEGQGRRVVVGLYDFAIEASKPLQTTLYAGTNGGAVLYEGAADGIKGRPKPLGYGDLTGAQIPVPQVNGAIAAFQAHDGTIQGTETVYDRGTGAGYTDDGDAVGAAFDAAAPAAAHYKTDHGRGLFKINGTPVGQLTYGFKGDATGGYVETAGAILARLLAKGGVAGGRIGASVAALASTSVMGFWAGDAITLADALRFVAAGAPAAVLPDRSSIWQAIAYGPAAAVADVTIGQHQVIACTADDAAPLPVGEVRIGWGRIWRTFTGNDLAPALVGTTSQERLASEYRWAVASDATVKARLPSSWRKVEIVTALRVEADATALATALLALLALRTDGKPRRMWRVTVERDTALAQTLGQTVQLTYAPQNIAAAKFLLVGEEILRPRRDQAIWTLWG